ncbi:MAG: hypothetical protein M3319_06750 [Actinomycetota bacterium]|nr:hypothetical protein [Actinomycetota bacterium]
MTYRTHRHRAARGVVTTLFGGFIQPELERIANIGDTLDALGHRFTVVEMDGRRVARVRITPAEGLAPDGRSQSNSRGRHELNFGLEIRPAGT